MRSKEGHPELARGALGSRRPGDEARGPLTWEAAQDPWSPHPVASPGLGARFLELLHSKQRCYEGMFEVEE